MFSVRPLLLMGRFRPKCPRLVKACRSERHLLQQRNLHAGEVQLSSGVGHGRNSLCNRTAEDENFDEEGEASTLENEEMSNEWLKQTKEELFEEISKGDPAVLKSLKLLDLEMAFLKSQNWRVPDYLQKKHWEELLQKKTLSQRRKFLGFLRLNELKNLRLTDKSKVRYDNYLRYRAEAGFHYYGISGHTMFMRIYDKSLNRLLHLRQLSGSGLKIVLDCSYEEHMSDMNRKICAKQLVLCATEARYHRQRCEISFCNFNRYGPMAELLPRYAPKFFEYFDSDIHAEDITEIFPKEKLVYLTPHSKNDLQFNPEDIFVIGAFVDRGTGGKISTNRASMSHIRHAKFPIDTYVFWKQGSKSLCLNTVLRILLDMGFYNDWRKALKNLPSRCLKNCNETHLQKKSNNFF